MMQYIFTYHHSLTGVHTVEQQQFFFFFLIIIQLLNRVLKTLDSGLILNV